MISEASRREKIANAVLGLTFAAGAAQSPKDFVRTGNIESPGTALMQTWGRKRGEAERNLDSGRVVARNVKKKTFKEFVEESYLPEQSREEAQKRDLQKTVQMNGESEMLVEVSGPLKEKNLSLDKEREGVKDLKD
jgi:hypothetical protein